VAPINIYEFEIAAKEVLQRIEYDFIAGGATDEITIRRNRAVFDAICLHSRVLSGVRKADVGTTALGEPIDLPILAAPAGDHGRAHAEAELATVRACHGAGTIMVLSSGSAKTLEEVADQSEGPIWYQQYLYGDRSLTLKMASRAADAGCSALCLTLDSGARTRRERNIRNGYVAALSRNYAGIAVPEPSSQISGDEPRGVTGLIDRAATWDDLAEFVHATSLPVVVKGIMTAEDAMHAVHSGARGIVVSNHGGRHLDTTLTPIEVLPDIASVVGDAAEVFLDGGIRRGTDIVKALALGARAVMIGRPVFWGLAVAGEHGVRSVFDILREELLGTLEMCGVPNLAAVDRSIVVLSSPLGLNIAVPLA
jgi:4-hydroxymandelate oxidase